MHLSKRGYQADFVVYPSLVAAAALLSLLHATRGQAGAAMAAALAGACAWTGIEYLLHRWLLHRVQPFRRMHAAHHANPAALIGTPTWLSVPVFVVLWAAMATQLPREYAGGFVAGLMLGYLFYAWVHHAVHHRRSEPGSWLYRVKLRHARHHRPGSSTDFGVSTSAWDYIFRSTPPVAANAAAT